MVQTVTEKKLNKTINNKIIKQLSKKYKNCQKAEKKNNLYK